MLFRSDKENNIVLVLDKIQSAKGAQIDLLFHPNVEATVSADGTYAALNGDSTRMEMKSMKIGRASCRERV